MSRLRRPAAVVAVAVVATLALAGCGSGGSKSSDVSDLSATKLLAKAKSEIKSQDTVSISGNAKSGSDGEVGLDLSYVGSDTTGKVTISNADLELLRVGDDSWFKASDAFWKAQAAAQADTIIKLVNGRWIVAPKGNADFEELTQLAEKTFVTKEILDPDGKVKKGKAKKVNGVDCVSLVSGDGTLYLDKSDGKPIQIVSTDKTEGGKLDFDYSKADAPKAPAKDEQVDLSSLG